MIEYALYYSVCPACDLSITPGDSIRHVPSRLHGYRVAIHAQCHRHAEPSTRT